MKKFYPLICLFSTLFFAHAEKPLNIVWIEADDLMPHFMGKLGEGFGYTPHLDQLAEKGVFFENAVCQAPMCGPSRNGLLANLYSHNLGFYRNGQMKCLPKGVWTFPRELQKTGYQTAYIGKSHIRPPQEDPKMSKDNALHFYGFDYANNTGERYAMWKMIQQGKENKPRFLNLPFIQHLKKRGKLEQFLADNKQYGKHSTMEEDIDYLDGFTTQVAVDWLQKKRDPKKPFFLWFNFCLPHGPYDVPQRWYDKVKKIQIPPPHTDRFGHPVPEPLLVDNRPLTQPKKVKEERLGEAANVAFMDAMIGKLMETLKKEGLLENTVVIFFSDHSIFLGNHGRAHKGTLFREVIGTSMIVSYPKQFPTDQINDHPVELMDLVPTTFELAGINKKAAKNGQSLLPLLAGKDNGRRYAFTEILGAQSVIDGHYHYIICGDQEFLYDWKTDPFEMKNVATKFPEVTERLRNAVQKWQEKTKPSYPPKHT